MKYNEAKQHLEQWVEDSTTDQGLEDRNAVLRKFVKLRKASKARGKLVESLGGRLQAALAQSADYGVQIVKKDTLITELKRNLKDSDEGKMKAEELLDWEKIKAENDMEFNQVSLKVKRLENSNANLIKAVQKLREEREAVRSFLKGDESPI